MMVRVELPTGVVGLVWTVRTEFPVGVRGSTLQLAVAPVGRPLILRSAGELKPF